MLSLRWIVLIASILFLLMLLPLALGPDKIEPNPPPLGIFNTAAELVTLKVPVVQVIELKRAGYLGGTRLTGTIHGELLIGTRLDHARVIRIDPKEQSLTVELPRPTLLHLKLLPGDQPAAIHRTGLWQFAPMPAHEATLTHQSLTQAEQMLTDAIDLSEAEHAAQEHAQTILSELFDQQGWKINLRWAN